MLVCTELCEEAPYPCMRISPSEPPPVDFRIFTNPGQVMVHHWEPLMLATAGLTALLVSLAERHNLLIRPSSPIGSRTSSTVKPLDR